MSRHGATLIGSGAVLLWSLLALLTAASGHIPPFQLAAMTFSIGGVCGASIWIFLPGRCHNLRQPFGVWLLGIGGLFGYHFFYFSALRAAPPVEASLIAFLWPLLIVLFSALLPNEKLKLHHLTGAILGFAGAALIVTKGEALAIKPQFAAGYAMALACALIWSSYSVASRRFPEVPTDVVTGFCLATAALSLVCHLLWEDTIWPSDLLQWLAVIGLGMGPVGLAFFLWDYGVKHGDIQILGTASYGAPLLSTLILIVLGFSPLSWIIAVACMLITSGAMLAAKDLWRR